MAQFPFGFGASDSGDSGGFDMNNLGAMFTQFGQMLQQSQNEGPLPWSTVMQVARSVLGTDPSVTDASVRAVESAMELADLWLNESVTFPASSTVVKVWSRSEWLVETAEVWQKIIFAYRHDNVAKNGNNAARARGQRGSQWARRSVAPGAQGNVA